MADRSNVIIHYPGTSDKIVSFVGSHMDTVPADPEQWNRDPFELGREGDKIFGRGVTDCLGHVALLACDFKKLAQLRPTLERGVVAVLIAKYAHLLKLLVANDFVFEHITLNTIQLAQAPKFIFF